MPIDTQQALAQALDLLERLTFDSAATKSFLWGDIIRTRELLHTTLNRVRAEHFRRDKPEVGSCWLTPDGAIVMVLGIADGRAAVSLEPEPIPLDPWPPEGWVRG